MVQKSFTIGQTLFKEGVSQVDGVYFIKQGDFEITINSNYADTIGKELNFDAKPQIRTKSPRVIKTITQPKMHIASKDLRLYVLGQFEVIGIEEIIEHTHIRKTTAKCVSLQGQCYFMAIDTFCDFVNQNKFS